MMPRIAPGRDGTRLAFWALGVGVLVLEVAAGVAVAVRVVRGRR